MDFFPKFSSSIIHLVYDVTPQCVSSGLLPTPQMKPHFHHPSEAQMVEHHEMGPCFDYDQRWSWERNCPTCLFLLVVDSDVT